MEWLKCGEEMVELNNENTAGLPGGGRSQPTLCYSALPAGMFGIEEEDVSAAFFTYPFIGPGCLREEKGKCETIEWSLDYVRNRVHRHGLAFSRTGGKA